TGSILPFSPGQKLLHSTSVIRRFVLPPAALLGRSQSILMLTSAWTSGAGSILSMAFLASSAHNTLLLPILCPCSVPDRRTMKAVVRETPILTSRSEMPRRHFKFDDDGITDEIAESRRPSSYFVPIASPKKKGKQLTFDTTWTQDRAKENDDINFIRSRVTLWRDRGYPSITPVTRALLEHWTRPDRERRLFFCQIEALEPFIYLTHTPP